MKSNTLTIIKKEFARFFGEDRFFDIYKEKKGGEE